MEFESMINGIVWSNKQNYKLDYANYYVKN